MALFDRTQIFPVSVPVLLWLYLTQSSRYSNNSI